MIPTQSYIYIRMYGHGINKHLQENEMIVLHLVEPIIAPFDDQRHMFQETIFHYYPLITAAGRNLRTFLEIPASWPMHQEYVLIAYRCYRHLQRLYNSQGLPPSPVLVRPYEW